MKYSLILLFLTIGQITGCGRQKAIAKEVSIKEYIALVLDQQHTTNLSDKEINWMVVRTLKSSHLHLPKENFLKHTIIVGKNRAAEEFNTSIYGFDDNALVAIINNRQLFYYQVDGRAYQEAAEDIKWMHNLYPDSQIARIYGSKSKIYLIQHTGRKTLYAVCGKDGCELLESRQAAIAYI